MNIKSVIDNYKAKKIPDEKAGILLIKNQGFKSELFLSVNIILSGLISVGVSYGAFLYFVPEDNYVTAFVKSMLLVLCPLLMFVLLSSDSLKYTKLSRFMPSNLLFKILPKKVRNKINKSIINEIVLDSLMPIESLKELSCLVDKREFDEFLRIANGEPTYKKMSEFFENVEYEKIKEEKISLLSDRLYNKLAISEDKE